MMLSDAILVSIITVLGGIITAYIAWYLKNRKPKADRVDDALAIYERILTNINADNSRLRAENVEKDATIEQQSREIARLRNKVKE